MRAPAAVPGAPKKRNRGERYEGLGLTSFAEQYDSDEDIQTGFEMNKLRHRVSSLLSAGARAGGGGVI